MYKHYETHTELSSLYIAACAAEWGGFFLFDWFRHVIGVWKECFTLFISPLAKLGVFYALTHFGMEKHEKEKLTWSHMTWHFSPVADCKWGSKRGREWQKEEGWLLILLLLLLLKNLVELLLWVEKCNWWIPAFRVTPMKTRNMNKSFKKWLARILLCFWHNFIAEKYRFGNEKSNKLKLFELLHLSTPVTLNAMTN